MELQINSKCKIDFSLSNNASLIQPTQTIVKSKYKKSKCTECNRRRKPLYEGDQICHVCYKIKSHDIRQSGNEVIDEFIKYTQINLVTSAGKMEFVPYDQFEDIEFISEGGFSKVYKATWINGPVTGWNGNNNYRKCNYTVVLKKLKNSINITSKELNELKVFYNIFAKKKRLYSSSNVCKYFGITRDPDSQEFVIVMPYYISGDLIHYITKNFYKISWVDKLEHLIYIEQGLNNIHSLDIIHRDFHSGNIFFGKIDDFIRSRISIGDLGISKSATESESNENYGIIPYMAPEIFQGQKYTKASDVYSLGMIMWELMTCRRPFWDRNHDTELILDICDGLRPPIVTNAPEGYIELMKECWHSDPQKRPQADDITNKLSKIDSKEYRNRFNNPTKIIESSNIGPVTINNPGAIYKSRSLSVMINSAMSLKSSRSQFINLEKGKRRFEDDLIKDDNGEDRSIKRKKLYENDDYLTRELELDIDLDFDNNEY
ncbi:kinase-like domain-containing protein [Rhizophagus clarus]|uniref:Kinase-like domain-containing protein n=1 Tax=Rhizophagus clarus TaxID=94130 RepID=A0A8H3KZQ1_9GLOM|nr:kinase-like domain-containing protein [Rhizophagus clarus]